MTKLFGLCPRCKSRIKINNVERLDGRKIACRDCGHTIRIHAPKKVVAGEESEELAVVEFIEDEVDDGEVDEVEIIPEPTPLKRRAARARTDDEFDAAVDTDEEMPPLRPLARPTRPKKKQSADDEDESSAFVADQTARPRAKGKLSPLRILAVCFGALLGFSIVSGGMYLLRSGGGGSSAKFEPPEKYVPIPVGLMPLAGQKPDGWKSKAGGGMRGIPIYINISDGGSISIDIRETEGSSAKGKMKKALLKGEEVHVIGGPSMGRLDQAPPVEATHAYHKDVVMKNFTDYKETSGQPIETGFGQGQISDFTAEEGLFHTRVKGCRASVVHRDHQYSIVCKCPPAQFKEVRPVFEKVIASLNPDEGPRGAQD